MTLKFPAYRRGLPLAFLYSGLATNIMAIVVTAKVPGLELGVNGEILVEGKVASAEELEKLLKG
jgi:hypothetical protein